MSTEEEDEEIQEEAIQRIITVESISSLMHNNYIINNQLMIPYLFDSPEKIIENILINIFNHNISPNNNGNIQLNSIEHKTKIKVLCSQYHKYIIVFILLKKLKYLIKKYKEKIFKLPDFEKLYTNRIQNNTYNSQKILPICRISKYSNFKFIKHKTKKNRFHSMPKIKTISSKIPDYFKTMEKVFCEIKNIKNCLTKSAIYIENIFSPALSEFKKFSIDECEKEEYYKVLIRDDFIWKELIKNKKTRLSYLLNELIIPNNKYINTMTEKFNYFKSICTCKKYKLNEIKICEIESSIDDKDAEEVIPISEIHQNIINDNSTKDNSINNENNNEEIIKNDTKNIEIKSNELKKNEIQREKLKSELKNEIELDVNIKKVYKIKKKNDNIHIINNNIKNVKKVNLNETAKEIKEPENKKDVPSDIDDLLKYIANDDEKENVQNTNKKKKKKNKKSKKKKNEEENEKNIDEDKEIDSIKEDLIKNSINRFKIHKIKFKYRPEWLEEIKNN